MLSLTNFNLQQGHKILLENAQFSIFDKQKMGLIGHNGCGKSSLFKAILDKKQPHDEILYSPTLRISHLAQEVLETDISALDYVLKGDEAYHQTLMQLKQAELEKKHETVLALHQHLEHIDGYRKPAIAASILSGLGFTTEEQNKAVKEFSGGWQMRLNLARCLIKPADLLLLDEPTNHLDLEAMAWLEKWLKQTPASVIVISHDRTFLDYFVTHIAHIDQQKITIYTGNYAQYEQVKALKLAQQQATYEKQQEKIDHLMSFVNRFKAKASKAKQAQSRLKAIERMDIIAKAQMDSPFSFAFKPIKKATPPLIHIENAKVGYDERIILNALNFNLNPGDRIGLLGPNGQGKSTLIKTLIGKLKPLEGEIYFGAHTEVGYYAQHQLEALDLSLSPIETLQALSPEAKEQDIRNFLGGFNFQGDMAKSPIKNFSGGEKARLALSKLVWQSPNVLFLDEPTNHLDIEMRTALALALETFEGAIVLVSHDRHLIDMVVSDFYLVFNQQVSEFDGTLEDYQKWIDQASKGTPPPSSQNPGREIDFKTRKTMQNRVKKIELLEASVKDEIIKLDEALSDTALYLATNKAKLDTLNQKKEALTQTLEALELEWMTLIEQLESSC